FQLWKDLGNTEAIDFAPWVEADAAAMVDDEKLVVVQVNGKVRAKVTVPAEMSEDDIKQVALADGNVA
ncbi:leucyl-tRNA synthetase, partial [Pasteurella multocida subsp. multocida str. Anand1_cattle]